MMSLEADHHQVQCGRPGDIFKRSPASQEARDASQASPTASSFSSLDAAAGAASADMGNRLSKPRPRVSVEIPPASAAMKNSPEYKQQLDSAVQASPTKKQRRNGSLSSQQQDHTLSLTPLSSSSAPAQVKSPAEPNTLEKAVNNAADVLSELSTDTPGVARPASELDEGRRESSISPSPGGSQVKASTPHDLAGKNRKRPRTSDAPALDTEMEAVNMEEKEGLAEAPAPVYEPPTFMRREIEGFMARRPTKGNKPAQAHQPGLVEEVAEGKKKRDKKAPTGSREDSAALILSNYGERSSRNKSIQARPTYAESSGEEQPSSDSQENSGGDQHPAHSMSDSDDSLSAIGESEEPSTPRKSKARSAAAGARRKSSTATSRNSSKTTRLEAGAKKLKNKDVARALSTKEIEQKYAGSDPEVTETEEEAIGDDDLAGLPRRRKSAKGKASQSRKKAIRPPPTPPSSGKLQSPKPSSANERSSDSLTRPIPLSQSFPSISQREPAAARSRFQRQTSDASDDETLPSLPVTSSFSILASQPRWDLSLLDEAIFVALPGKRKESTEVQPDAQMHENGDEDPGSANPLLADVPKFWWPARILSRNRAAFKVKLAVDAKKSEIFAYSAPELILPQSLLSEDNLVNLRNGMTDEMRFKDIDAATVDFASHPEADSFTYPSKTAFKDAWRQARKSSKNDESDDLPELGASSSKKGSSKAKSPNKKGSPSKGSKGKQSSEEEDDDSVEGDNSFTRVLNSVKSSQTRIESASESEELDDEIEIGTIGLALVSAQKDEWWPARVIAVRPMAEVKAALSKKKGAKGRASGRTTKNGPYRVELYPPKQNGQPDLRDLWREHFLTHEDEDFGYVNLGRIQDITNHEEDVTSPERLNMLLPSLTQLLEGKYEPGRARYDTFFGSRTDRAALHVMLRFGEFEEAQIKSLSDFLESWLEGQESDYPLADVPELIESLSKEDKVTFVAGVLLPTALELLVIDDDGLEETAQEELQRDNGLCDPAAVQMRAHELAGEVLEQAVSWYKKVYTQRQFRETMHNAKKRLQLKAGPVKGSTGRSAYVSYKE